VLLGSGLSAATLWSHGSLFQQWPMLLHHLVIVHGLWYAPIYGWLLLVSAWARRAPFLWATLPLLAIGVVEKIAFNTSYFVTLLGHRLIGGPGDDNFMGSSLSMDPLMHFTPGAFLISPGLWLGLALAAAFLAAAVRLRRYRDPLGGGGPSPFRFRAHEFAESVIQERQGAGAHGRLLLPAPECQWRTPR
jgi:ABC-2 type transport system permease protein